MQAMARDSVGQSAQFIADVLGLLNAYCVTKGEFFVVAAGAVCATSRRLVIRGPDGLLTIPLHAIRKYSLTDAETLVYADRHGNDVVENWSGTFLKEEIVAKCRSMTDSGTLDENMRRMLWTPRAELVSQGLIVPEIQLLDPNAPLDFKE